MGTQTLYDTYENDGGAFSKLRKVVSNNPTELALCPTPSNLGLIGYNFDPSDATSITQAIVSGTLYASYINLNSNTPVSKIGTFLGSTLLATPGTYSGFAVYSAGALTASLLASTGADDGAKWAAATASTYFQDSLTATQYLSAGGYYIAFIATATTTPTLVSVPTTFNTITVGSITINRSMKLAAQTSFPATLTYSGMTANTFAPVMGIA